MQLVNGAQFLNITFLLVLLTSIKAAGVFGTVIVVLTCMSAPLQSHRFDLIIEALNLMSLSALYVPRDSSFISIQFLVLSLDDWFVVSSKNISSFFDIPLLDYKTTLFPDHH